MKTWHWISLGILTLISLFLEFTMLSGYDAHWWNAIPGFYILWGSVSCIAAIYGANWIGKFFLYRDETYYDH